MNRIDAIFRDLRASGSRGLMPFVCGGHPSLGTTQGVLPALERAGASIVEIGFPFSDPIADGPVIAAAMHEALLAGVTPRSVLDTVSASRRAGLKIGVVAMISVSIVERMGPRRLVQGAAAAGFDGFIFPDVPLEESEPLLGPVRDAGLTASLLVAPTTPPERMARIVRACSGFVYLLARVGITGAQQTGGAAEADDPAALRQRVALLRTMTDLPIACGFGIATPDDVRATVRSADRGGAGADAAIVGSALVKRMSRAAAAGNDPVEDAESFVRSLAAGLSG